MSYVLPFDNSVCSETARSAIDNFASILINVFVQYQTLWKENVDLQKKYEESKRTTDIYQNIKKEESSQEICSTCSRKLNNSTDVEQNFCIKKETSIKQEPKDRISQNSPVDHNSKDFLEGIVLDPYFDNVENVSNNSVTLTEMPNAISNAKSPIISRNRTKPEKYTPVRRKVSRNLEKSLTYGTSSGTPEKNTHDKSFIKDSQQNIEKNTPLQPLENKIPFIDSTKKSNDVNRTTATGNASTSKDSGKLTFGKLYNVKTTFSCNNKLKQTRLLFVPPKQVTELVLSDDSSIVDDTICDEMKSEEELRKNEKPATKKNCSVENDDRTFCEDIIEPSPKQTLKPTNLNKFLRLKRKSPDSIMQTTQEGTDFSSNEKMFKKDDTEIADESDVLANMDLSEFENNENFLPHNADTTDVLSPKNETANATNVDETYCELDDIMKDCVNNQDSVFFEDEITSEGIMQLPKPKTTCNSLLPDFNKMPEKNVAVNYNKPVRKKSERAKLQGFSCRDCEKYYEGMDLSENELQKRKNLCSRHRGRQKVRIDTPEGFWDPYFPDMCTASFSYD